MVRYVSWRQRKDGFCFLIKSVSVFLWRNWDRCWKMYINSCNFVCFCVFSGISIWRERSQGTNKQDQDKYSKDTRAPHLSPSPDTPASIHASVLFCNPLSLTRAVCLTAGAWQAQPVHLQLKTMTALWNDYIIGVMKTQESAMEIKTW